MAAQDGSGGSMRPPVTKRNADAGTSAASQGVLPDSSNNTERAPEPQVGKSLAVLLYCLEVRSLSATRAAFARHPEWVSA